MTVHIVQKGDTLWKIAKEYDVSFEQLKKMNAHLANPEYIVPGMKVNVPEEKRPKDEPISLDESKRGKTEKPAQKTEHNVVTKQEKEKVPPVPETPPKVEKQPSPSRPTPAPTPGVEGQMPSSPLANQEYAMPPQQVPMQPIQPIQIIGIPCGWMPIYDPDCMRAFPMQQMPEAFPHTRHLQHHQADHHTAHQKKSNKPEKRQKPSINEQKKEQGQIKVPPSLQSTLVTPEQERPIGKQPEQQDVRPMPHYQYPKQKTPELQPPKQDQPPISVEEQYHTPSVPVRPQAPVIPQQPVSPPPQQQSYHPYYGAGFPQQMMPSQAMRCAYCQQHYLPQPASVPAYQPFPYWQTSQR